MTTKHTYMSDNSFHISNNLIAAMAAVIHTVSKTVAIWNSRMIQRRHLLDLDPSQLDDIGINKGEAIKEAAKTFWQA